MIKLIAVACIVNSINDEGLNFWLQPRSEIGPLDGLLEMPGGKIEAGESASTAIMREVFEETGYQLIEPSLFKIYRHDYEDRRVALYTYLIEGADFNGKGGNWCFLSWNEDLAKHRLLEANFVIFEEVRRYLKKQYDAGLIEQIWK